MSLAVLIVLSIALVFTDTLVLPPGWHSFLVSLSFGVDFFFCGEILLRWRFEKKENRDWRLILDTVAVIPAFLGVLGGFGFFAHLRPQALQRLRFIRLIRLLRLVRLGNVMARQCDAMAHSIGEGLRENLIIVISLLMIFFFGALGIRLVEPQVESFADALWYSLFTLMAGEPIPLDPITPEGRFVTILVMLGGFTLFALFTGVVSALVIQRLRTGFHVGSLEQQRIKGHIVLCGWNSLGKTLIRELLTKAQDVAVVLVAKREEPDLGEVLPDRKRFFFYPEDYSVSETLEKVRLPQARGAVVLADDAEKRSDQDRDVRSILTALTLEKASGEGNIQTCVELLEKTPEKVEVLKMAGVEDVFEGRSYTARLLAHGAHASGLISFFDELFTSHRGCEFSRLSSEGYQERSYLEVLEELKISRDILPLALVSRKDPNKVLVNPSPEHSIAAEEDFVVIERRNAEVEEFSRPFGRKEMESGGNHVVLCGWNRGVPLLLHELHCNQHTRRGTLTLVAEIDPREHLEECKNLRFIRGDWTLPGVLKEAGALEASTVVFLADESLSRSSQDRDARSILGALTLRRMTGEARPTFIVELIREDARREQLLRDEGISEVVVREKYVGHLAAHFILTPGLAQVINELLTSNLRNEFRKVLVPPEYWNLPYGSFLVERKRDAGELVLAVERREGEKGKIFVNPPEDFLLIPSDWMFVIAPAEEKP
jgi:voltage-gated potassium channel